MKSRVFLQWVAVTVALLSQNIGHAADGKQMVLDWETKINYRGIVEIRFLSAKIANNELVFDILLHNAEKDGYMCFWLTTSEDTVHIDDDLGNSYKGGKFSIKDGDNKLAPNQRKRIEAILPIPKQEAKLVNIHLGINVDDTNNSPENNCGNFVRSDKSINYHRLDWDISDLK